MTTETNISRVHRLLDEVACAPYQLLVMEVDPARQPAALVAALWRQDSDTGKWGWGYGSPHLVYADTPDDVVIKQAFVATRDYAEHETREGFLYRGKRILGPHVPLDTLWEII